MNKKSLILLPAMMMILASCNNDTTTDSSSSTTTPTSETTGSQTSTSTSGSETPSSGVNYGTEEAPLTVETFKVEAAKLNLADKAYSDKKFFVKDVVDTVSSYLTLTGNVRIYDYSSEEIVYQNDTVLVEGYIQCSVSYEKSYFNFAKSNDEAPLIKSVTRGTSKVTATIENGKVNGLEASYTNGETASFTVEVDSGFELKSVSVYGVDLTDSEGTYSFVVKGDTSVLVTIAEEGVKTWQIITSAPEVGKSYRAGLNHQGIADTPRMYLNGKTETKAFYQDLSTDEAEALTVVVEVNGEGFNIKVGDKYLVCEADGSYKSSYYRDTASTTPWLWDADFNSFTFDLNGTKMFVGARNDKNFKQIQASDYNSYKNTNEHLHLYEEK